MTVETFHGGRVTLHGGDCLDVLATLPEASVDAVVTDPPYHFASIVKRFGKEGSAPARSNGATGIYQRAAKGFMGKEWDGGQIAHEPETWAAVLRVLKPGGHLVAFHAPKNWHRQVCAIEDAGFEIRDSILDFFSAGDLAARFLASLSADQQQALVRLVEAGDQLGDLFWLFGSGFPKSHNLKGEREGFGTALKPAYEPIVLARKPFRGSVADCMQEYGTGAINIAASYVGAVGGTVSGRIRGDSADVFGNGLNGGGAIPVNRGRWPANVTHDDSAEVLAAFPRVHGAGAARDASQGTHSGSGGIFGPGSAAMRYGDTGSPARFFYSAKADSDDRLGSKHPTVKPIDLMRWLVRMITPPGGVVLDPFAGTGTTAQAAFVEGFNAILIEREEEYRADIRRRMELLLAGPATKAAALSEAAPDYGPLFGGDAGASGGGGRSTENSQEIGPENRPDRTEGVA